MTRWSKLSQIAGSRPFIYLLRGVGCVFLLAELLALGLGRHWLPAMPALAYPLTGAFFGLLLSYRMTPRMRRIAVVAIVAALCLLLLRPA